MNIEREVSDRTGRPQLTGSLFLSDEAYYSEGAACVSDEKNSFSPQAVHFDGESVNTYSLDDCPEELSDPNDTACQGCSHFVTKTTVDLQPR